MILLTYPIDKIRAAYDAAITSAKEQKLDWMNCETIWNITDFCDVKYHHENLGLSKKAFAVFLFNLKEEVWYNHMEGFRKILFRNLNNMKPILADPGWMDNNGYFDAKSIEKLREYLYDLRYNRSKHRYR